MRKVIACLLLALACTALLTRLEASNGEEIIQFMESMADSKN